jgi:ketosteroid isomerase-like protein
MSTGISSARDEAQIRGLLEDRVKAIAEKNVDAVLSEYAPDVVMYNLAPPLQTKGASREAVEKWFSGYKSEIGCEIRDLSISTSYDVGFCHYLYKITGTLTSGKDVNMWVRATLCFHKIRGRWKIVHEHDSDPFDMQTFKALMDLEP